MIAIIQARFGSSRLPGKILTEIGGKPVLQHVIERVQKSRFVEEVMVATSIERDNLPVLGLCADLGVRAFAGSENDVLDRYYQLAKLVKPQYVIRVTADCPCYDPEILDAAIEKMHPTTDHMSYDETLPDGLDIEIVKFSALEKAWQEAKLASEREHVTLYIRNNPGAFKIQSLPYPAGDFGHMRWTLDEPEDLQLITQIFENFASNPDFRTSDILRLFENNPDLSKINAHIARNEGLAKSLQNDRSV